MHVDLCKIYQSKVITLISNIDLIMKIPLYSDPTLLGWLMFLNCYQCLKFMKDRFTESSPPYKMPWLIEAPFLEAVFGCPKTTSTTTPTCPPYIPRNIHAHNFSSPVTQISLSKWRGWVWHCTSQVLHATPLIPSTLLNPSLSPSLLNPFLSLILLSPFLSPTLLNPFLSYTLLNKGKKKIPFQTLSVICCYTDTAVNFTLVGILCAHCQGSWKTHSAQCSFLSWTLSICLGHSYH